MEKIWTSATAAAHPLDSSTTDKAVEEVFVTRDARVGILAVLKASEFADA
jgi:hypothetical protein